jgi:flagellar biogenesis protein FliO
MEFGLNAPLECAKRRGFKGVKTIGENGLGIQRSVAIITHSSTLILGIFLGGFVNYLPLKLYPAITTGGEGVRI